MVVAHTGKPRPASRGHRRVVCHQVKRNGTYFLVREILLSFERRLVEFAARVQLLRQKCGELGKAWLFPIHGRIKNTRLPIYELVCPPPRPSPSSWKRRTVDQGVSSRRQQYYGGSAAQSTLFPALDAALDVSHSKHSSNVFLLEMRNYMPPGEHIVVVVVLTLASSMP